MRVNILGEELTPGRSIQERLDTLSVPEPNTGCRLWIGALQTGGYGKLGVAGKFKRAHRLAYEEAHGGIPDDLQVCHRCDTPGCIELAHLFLGTCRDNAADKWAKGRAPSYPGELAPRAKLTADDIREVRRLNSVGVGYRKLAKRYGVHRTTIRLAVIRKNWPSVS